MRAFQCHFVAICFTSLLLADECESSPEKYIGENTVTSLEKQRRLQELDERIRDVPVEGHESCPCITLEESQSNALGGEGITFVGNDTDLDTYGIGCGYHDVSTAICLEDLCDRDSALVSCERPWCQFAWCYVDHNKCGLANSPSTYFPRSSRYFSYATCRYADVFNNDFLLLSGETIKISLNSNSGGWTGAYHKNGLNFVGDLESDWLGPAVTYIKDAARIGNVKLEVREPPPFLIQRSTDFFGESTFDRCIYAVSLGFLDMCVGSYKISEQRASVVDWIVLNTQDLWLVTKSDDEAQQGMQKFWSNVQTIFLPFTGNAWLFITLFVIPVLGILMVVHEKGKTGSSYPTNETIIRVHRDALGEQEIVERPVPLYQHIGKAVYVSFLAVLQIGYFQPVISLGAKFNLIGISFFCLTLWAVYTANLAAILTEQSLAPEIGSLEDALNAQFRFCVTRPDMQIIQSIHNLDSALFVVDPVEEGGDGKPGFNCPRCVQRQRTFDFLDPDLANTDERYCHAAIALLEDLDVEHSFGRHCNKTVVGTSVGKVEVGMPIFAGISKELVPLLLKLKNNGIYDSQLIGLRPEPVCGAFPAEDEENIALTIEKLTGIWVVSFGFAIAGLLVTFLKPVWDKMQTKRIVKVEGCDQLGRKVDMLEPSDAWIAENGMVDDDGKVVLTNQIEFNLPKKEDRGEPQRSREWWKKALNANVAHRALSSLLDQSASNVDERGSTLDDFNSSSSATTSKSRWRKFRHVTKAIGREAPESPQQQTFEPDTSPPIRDSTRLKDAYESENARSSALWNKALWSAKRASFSSSSSRLASLVKIAQAEQAHQQKERGDALMLARQLESEAEHNIVANTEPEYISEVQEESTRNALSDTSSNASPLSLSMEMEMHSSDISEEHKSADEEIFSQESEGIDMTRRLQNVGTEESFENTDDEVPSQESHALTATTPAVGRRRAASETPITLPNSPSNQQQTTVNFENLKGTSTTEF